MLFYIWFYVFCLIIMIHACFVTLYKNEYMDFIKENSQGELNNTGINILVISIVVHSALWFITFPFEMLSWFLRDKK